MARRGGFPCSDVQGVFKVGEEVKCLVMGLDPGYTNISLSVAGGWLGGCVHTLVWSPARLHTPPPNTRCLDAELELEEGDVLANKQQVWDCAVSQAALFRDHLELLREQGFDFDADAVVAEA